MVYEALKLVGHRPEMLRDIIADVALEGGASNLADQLANGAVSFRDRIWGEMESEFNDLTKTQQAVLERMLQEKEHFVPFSAASLKAYSELAKQEVAAPDAQGALNALRQKNLIWQSEVGKYALEDQSMLLWYQNRTSTA